MASPYESIGGIAKIVSSSIQYKLVDTGPYRSPYSPYTYLTPGRLYTHRRYKAPSVAVFNEDETALGGLWDSFFQTEGFEAPLLYTGQSLEQLSTNKNGFHFHQDRLFVFLCSTKKILVAREDIRQLKRFTKSMK